MTRTRWLLLGIAVTLGICAYRGLTLVDSGYIRSWSDWPRFVWVFGSLVTGVIALAATVDLVVGVVDGDDTPVVLPGLTLAAFGFFCFGALGHLLQRSTGFDERRSWLIGVGGFLIVCAWLKPWWFWESPKARWLRSLIGDVPTMITYVLMGAGMILAGVLTVHPVI